MNLEISHDECQLLAEILGRRADELDVEEHRSEAWHYRDMLHGEQALLKQLLNKLAALREDSPTTAFAPGASSV